MEFKRLWKLLFRWWWLIAVPPVIVAGYGLLTYQAPTGGYAATLHFTASQPPVSANPNYDPNYYRWLTSEYIVNGLKDWVRTGAFAQAVSAELATHQVAVPAGAVNASIASDNVRSVLVVYLNGADETTVLALAQALTIVLQNENSAAFPQLGGQAAIVVPLDAPAAGPTSPGLRARLDLPLKIALALAVGLALALAAHYFDPFLRDAHDLQQIDLPLLGEIPSTKK